MDGTFFCSGDGRQAGLWYLAAGYRDTTTSLEEVHNYDNKASKHYGSYWFVRD